MVQIREPVEPCLTFDLTLLSWLRALKAEETRIAIVEPQTISSILGASEKWSMIPATYILVGGGLISFGGGWCVVLVRVGTGI